MENEGRFPPTRLEFLLAGILYAQYLKLGIEGLTLRDFAQEVWGAAKEFGLPSRDADETAFDASAAERDAAHWFDEMKRLAKETGKK